MPFRFRHIDVYQDRRHSLIVTGTINTQSPRSSRGVGIVTVPVSDWGIDPVTGGMRRTEDASSRLILIMYIVVIQSYSQAIR